MNPAVAEDGEILSKADFGDLNAGEEAGFLWAI